MSKSLIKRRSLLKALGGASFLAAPVFRASLAEAQAAPVRLLVLYFGGGGMPGSEYSGFTFDKVFSPLAPYSSDILLLQNMKDPQSSGGVDFGHGGVRVALTGDGRGIEEDVFAFVPPGMTSIDQTIAQSVGKNTKFASLQFGVMSGGGISGEGWDPVSIVYSNGAPVTAVQDPQTMFTRLFSGGTPAPGPAPTGSTPEDAAALAKLKALAAQRRSMLDILKGQVTDIQGLVGSAEKLRLEEHLASLRELEKQIMDPAGGPGGGPAPTPGASCAAPSLGSGTDFPALSATMSELLFQSINCDSTRVATFQLANSGSQMVFTWLGQNTSHHDMQHAPTPDLLVAQTWLISQIAVIIKRLKDTPEGAGSMLDNCLVYVTSEMGDGSSHTNNPVPVLLAGKAGGQLRTGRTLDMGGKARTNLSLNLANMMGVPLTTHGDPAWITGPLNLG
ncbi:MAG: DUF1552 domain-containing protein [Polyangiaceae bacterium]|nr:DUF1552 domain-containing protein [Polyangiaceae bacterium]